MATIKLKLHLESPPAAVYSVGSQSVICIRWKATLCRFSKYGLQINAAPRTPPSHNVFFTLNDLINSCEIFFTLQYCHNINGYI